jgi:hypothetical protein
MGAMRPISATKGKAMYELVHVYRYREKRATSGAPFPNDHPLAQQLRELVPSKQRDNHQVVIFSVGKDGFERQCDVAAFFCDNYMYLCSMASVKDGDCMEFYKGRV